MNKLKDCRYLILLAMIYMVIDLSSMVYAFKEIKISFVVGMASSILFPLTYLIMDIITEVYGYKIARAIIWFGIIGDFIFATMTFFLSFIPSPSVSQYMAYQVVLSPLLRAVVAQSIGLLMGSFINIYLISKWRVMTNGKYFWLRSIGSSTIGEAITLIVSVLIALSGRLDFLSLANIIFYAYLYKIIFAILVSPVGNTVAYFLAHKEGIDLYDRNVDFNPFKLQEL